VTSAVSRAAWRMAAAHCGALIVLERRDGVTELVSPGVALNAIVSEPLLTSIFRKDSPLHDGAVVIDGDTVTHASAILPLTQRTNVPNEYGTRHRAAMGLTDRSDAVTVVASEERGMVTVVSAGEARARCPPSRSCSTH
jgi:diadenylate cyclase